MPNPIAPILLAPARAHAVVIGGGIMGTVVALIWVRA